MTAPRRVYQAIGGTPASARAQIEAVGPMSSTASTPLIGDVLTWNGTAWVPQVGGGGGGGMGVGEFILADFGTQYAPLWCSSCKRLVPKVA